VTGQELQAAALALLAALDEEHERRPLSVSTTARMARVRHLAARPPAKFHPQGTVIADRSS
jgi:hypothetical protein